ncbi:MAG: ABC transporter permease [Cyclobacteriaceae bacterium]|nr:ABC transporter permease [Cyclobacteriaceae bacterium]
MNLPYFISNRISTPKAGTFSSTIHKVAIFSIGIGLTVMILAFAIMQGFKNTIKNKIYDFSGHIQITKYVSANAYNENPLKLPDTLHLDGIKNIVPFAFKAGLLQTNEEVEGVVFKGVGRSFDSTEFKQYLKAGRFIHFKDSSYSTEVIISRHLANRLKLKVGGSLIMHFFQDPPRARKLTIVGIYETGMEDFDNKIMVGDIGLAQRLNDWADGYAGGFEVYVNNVDQIDAVQQRLYDTYGYDYYVQKTSHKFLQVFEWLSLIDNNVNILLFMVLFVASFNMISIILILILERTPMIGTLKALGAQNGLIRKIFVYNGMQLIVKGLIVGNVLGLGLALLQWKFKFITLDPSNYYMDYVPIEFNFWILILLNLLVMGLVSAILILPTLFVSRVEPIKAIKFD